MRVGVWWSAAGLLLLAVAISAIRTSQVEGTPRIGRRLPSTSEPKSSSSTAKVDDVQPTTRPRSHRRREEPTSSAPRDTVRTRSRKVPDKEVIDSIVEQSLIEDVPNERFDSRRTGRVRSRPVDDVMKADATISSRDNVVRSKSRQSNRRPQFTTTQVPPELTSPKINDAKFDVHSSSNDIINPLQTEEITKNQFRRRSSTTKLVESVTISTPKEIRPRGRVNARVANKLEDTVNSGALNNAVSLNEPSFVKLPEEARNSRKLRYRTRPSETDTNYTDESIKTSNEVIKPSKRKEKYANTQSDIRASSPAPVARNLQRNTERTLAKTTTLKATRVLRRPVSKAKSSLTSAVASPRVSDEIGDDENYPESFKALIQAKNASTQASSPTSESLSVKASQKVYNTYTQSSQSTDTAPDSNRFARLRSKLNTIGNESKKSENEDITITTMATEMSDPDKDKPQEYRLRGSYVTKNRSLSSLSSTVATKSTTSTNSVTDKPVYKFTRKFKSSSTTETSNFGGTTKNERFQVRNITKSNVSRASFRSRYSDEKNANISTLVENKGSKINNGIVRHKSKLPRTAYYSNSRNKYKQLPTKEESPLKANETPIAEEKIEDTADMPLIFTFLGDLANEKVENKDGDKFLTAVNNKESQQNNTENELVKAENSETKSILNQISTTQKYHANYKNQRIGEVTRNNGPVASNVTPPIKNIHTRKYSRKIVKNKEKIESSSANTTASRKERTMRKYSDTFSKTTEATTNGITPEPEKHKSKFSSKYRASYLDKPFYKPTVPTVTPSTVVGEEIQLGPDMNAISFTQSRSTLSSADLRLSESLVKPSHIMNVEASNHSPSVTVSIFDALAEILTSTPRIQISTTTEVPQTSNINSDVEQTFNGVSNNINVNSVTDLSSQDTRTSTDGINTITTAQNTDQTTPNVFNRLSVGETVVSSVNVENMKPMFTNAPFTTPTPSPSITNSARRPFAIKVLYTDTDRPTDERMTSSETTSNLPTTDNPRTVYNTVSDLLLSNNKLVSSELTSMLSNNIKKIMKNLDENSRSKLSVDMEKILNTLIPKAMNILPTILDDVDSLPSTTPYSLEEIKDTENIDISNSKDINIQNENFLQNVLENNVNNTQVTNSRISSSLTTEQAVYSSNISQSITDSTLSVSETEIPLAETETTSKIDINEESSFDDSNTAIPVMTTVKFILQELDTATESTSETDTTEDSAGNESTPSNDSTNKPLPLPLFTNTKIVNFSLEESKINNDNISIKNPSLSLITLPTSQTSDIDINNIEDPSQVSRLQLWILSKKARVLKMIEQLIREHNDEIAKAPLTEFISEQSNIPISNRLTEIMNTMNVTTDSDDIENNDKVTTQIPIPSSTFENNESPTQLTTTESTMTETLENRFSADVTLSPTTFNSDIMSIVTTSFPTEITSTFSAEITETAASQANREIADALLSTTTIVSVDHTTMEDSTEGQDISPTTIESTKNEQADNESSESLGGSRTSTETDLTTDSNIETTTQTGITTSTITNINETDVNDILTNSAPLNVATRPTIPKRDYVIFGILPNNTVVRKNPNDNVLETLTEASPYIIYGVLPNNTVIRKFPNGTRVPRIMQKIDVLPISPWSLRNPYSPIHNNPAIVRPQSNPIRVSTNIVTYTDANNGMEKKLTTDTVNNQQITMSSSALNIKDSSSLGIITATIKPHAEISTASHVLSLRTTTMLPSIHEILLNSISSATKEEMVISSMTSSTREPRILTLDIDPETKQIRTEKPGDGKGNAVFKFIPIDEVTVSPQDTNVLKLASSKAPTITNTINKVQIVTPMSVTETNTPTSQVQTSMTNVEISTIAVNAITPVNSISSTTIPVTTLGIPEQPSEVKSTMMKEPITSQISTMTTPIPTMAMFTTDSQPITNEIPSKTIETITSSVALSEIDTASTPSSSIPSFTNYAPTTQATVTGIETDTSTSTLQPPITNVQNDIKKLKEDSMLLQQLLQALSTTLNPTNSQEIDRMKLLQALLSNNGLKAPATTNLNLIQPTTLRTIAEDIKQFEEDTKLLNALLQATGKNPGELNISQIPTTKVAPTLSVTSTEINPFTTTSTSTTITSTTSAPLPTTSTSITPSISAPLSITSILPTATTQKSPSTTISVAEDIKRLQEDTKLLQALLQYTNGQNSGNLNLPVISGITSNVRVASNPLTTSIESSPTTPINIRPVYTTPGPTPIFTTVPEVSTTLQAQRSTLSEDIGISTTFPPFDRKVIATTTESFKSGSTPSVQSSTSRLFTTEMPMTSTFSVEEDLAFLKNLKSVLNTNNNNEDPEAALANRIIALAVERSLDEIQTNKPEDSLRVGKNIGLNANSMSAAPTTLKITTTTRLTTTTPKFTTTIATQSTPSIEEDLKQFEEDTKLLQALLKATGQDPSKFNIPTLPSANVSPNDSPVISQDLEFLSNLLASPSPLNEPFDPLIQKPNTNPTTLKPLDAKIAVKDELKNVQDDAQLLQTLIKLKDAQEATTLKNKITITGQSSDEALQNLIQQAKPTGMVSEATKSDLSLSTEFGNSNDALLAALLKEQGFGPTTASSVDEQVRLAALLNQVVVTPKARRTTTAPPPPPPAPRRPILDGLAWLWQQWRDTAPGSGGSRTNNKRPPPPSKPSASPAAATTSRVNWFGSGPFVGNADDRPPSNRIPLEPPRAVAAEQAPGRGQLVSAAINVTRAFSQFLGAAIQGAAQTVQNVIRAGQRAATDVYTNGSG